MAGKYFRITKTAFQNINEYKLEFFGEYLRIPVIIGLSYLLWDLIFSLSGKNVIGGMNFYDFLIYIGMAAFIGNALPSWEVSEKITEFILKGNIVILITKPVSFIAYFFSRESASFLTRGILGVLFFEVISWLFGWYAPTSFLTILLFLIALILGMVLQFFVITSLAMLSFFVYAIWGLRNVLETLRYFFSGELIPLTLFPAWLLTLASILPFKYAIFVPLFIYLEKYSLVESLKMIGLQLIFIFIFVMLCKFIYSKGLKKTDGQGG